MSEKKIEADKNLEPAPETGALLRDNLRTALATALRSCKELGKSRPSEDLRRMEIKLGICMEIAAGI